MIYYNIIIYLDSELGQLKEYYNLLAENYTSVIFLGNNKIQIKSGDLPELDLNYASEMENPIGFTFWPKLLPSPFYVDSSDNITVICAVLFNIRVPLPRALALKRFKVGPWSAMMLRMTNESTSISGF